MHRCAKKCHSLTLKFGFASMMIKLILCGKYREKEQKPIVLLYPCQQRGIGTEYSGERSKYKKSERMKDLDYYDMSSAQEKWYILAMVANLYYNLNLTQSQIAERIYTSRSKVSRLLKEARDLGVVEIYIRELWTRELDCEQKIKDEFGLNTARVIKLEASSREEGIARLGKVAAYYLDSAVRKNMVIGISWGNTLYEIVKYISQMNRKNIPITVVPIMGAVNMHNPERNTIDLAKDLSQAYGGHHQYIYAPLFVNSTELRDSLVQEEYIRDSLNMARSADLILTSVGSIADRSWSNYFSDNVWKKIVNEGAVGHIGGRFFDSDGNEVVSRLAHRMIGVELDDIKKCKDVICVAYGEGKSDAVLGALRGGFINTLIMDETCAQKVVEKM